MTRGLRLMFVMGALAVAARGAIGCATSDEVDGAKAVDDAGEEATVIGDAPAPDGAVTDAGPDTYVPPAKCSADGWCYSGLPEAGSYDASALPATVSGVQFMLRAVWADAAQHAWAVSEQGHVLYWDGTSWTVKTIATRPLHAVWGWGTSDVWVGGDGGLVLHGTIVGGVATFQTVTIGTTQTIYRIAGRSATDVWAIADGVNSQAGTLNRVFRLNAAGTAFAPTTVASPFTDSTGKLRIWSLWTSGDDVWVAGYANTCGGPGKCKFADETVALKWNGDADGGADSGAPDAGDGGEGGVAEAGAPAPAWDAIPLLRDFTYAAVAAISTPDGVQLLAHADLYGDNGWVTRIARDDSKLDGGPVDSDGDSGISHEGAYSWTDELAESYGGPQGIWATSQNDAWIIGLGGTVRHFDGTAWQLVHLSTSKVTPLLDNLYGIHGNVSASGEQNIWIVGDDVAIHRTVTP